jgi:murein DD-endopeptidase MepM/ murein hydrolase activator NlpD
MSLAIKLNLPVSTFILTQYFGENPGIYRRFGRAGHNGLDFAVPAGTPVLAAAAGCVVKIGHDPAGYGNYVLIDHGVFETLYAHLQTVELERGAPVQAGELLARSDNTGFSTGPHLHFELRIPDNKTADYPAGEVDPTPYFVALPKIDSDTGDIPGEHDLTGSGANVAADSNPICRVNAIAGLNVHIKPALESEVIGAFKYRQELTVMKQDGDWLGVLVWVHKDWTTDF